MFLVRWWHRGGVELPSSLCCYWDLMNQVGRNWPGMVVVIEKVEENSKEEAVSSSRQREMPPKNTFRLKKLFINWNGQTAGSATLVW